MAGSGNNIEQFEKQTSAPNTQQDLNAKLHSEGYDSNYWKGGGMSGGKLPAGFEGFHIAGVDNQGLAQGEGFHKEAPYQHDGLTGLWNGIKHIVGANDTVEDKLKEGLYKSLPKSEQEAIDKERAAQRAEMTSTTLMTDNRSFQEKYPHLAKFEQQVHKEEDAISKQVLSGMSPEDRARLKQQEDAYYKLPEHFNPAGTGEGFRPRPEAGPMLKEYWERIAEATQKRYGS